MRRGSLASHIPRPLSIVMDFSMVFLGSQRRMARNKNDVNRATIIERITFQSFRIHAQGTTAVTATATATASSPRLHLVAHSPQQIEIWPLICVGLIYRPHRDE